MEGEQEENNEEKDEMRKEERRKVDTEKGKKRMQRMNQEAIKKRRGIKEC